MPVARPSYPDGPDTARKRDKRPRLPRVFRSNPHSQIQYFSLPENQVAGSVPSWVIYRLFLQGILAVFSGVGRAPGQETEREKKFCEDLCWRTDREVVTMFTEFSPLTWDETTNKKPVLLVSKSALLSCQDAQPWPTRLLKTFSHALKE